MTTSVGTITIEMAANVARLQQDMRRARTTVDSAVGSMTKAVGLLAKAFAGLATVAFFKNAINNLDALSKLSARTGILASDLSGLKLVADLSDTSLEQLAIGINKLNVNMAKSPEAFKRIGIQSKDVKTAFIELVGVLENIDDQQTKAAIATKALGIGWQNLAPALALGKDELVRLIEKGKEMSQVTDEMAEKAAEFNDMLTMMSTWLSNVAIKMVGPFLSGLVTIINQIREANAAGFTFIGTLKAIGNFDVFKGTAKQLSGVNKSIAETEKIVAFLEKTGQSTLLADKQKILNGLYAEQVTLYEKLKIETDGVNNAQKETVDPAAIKALIGVKEVKEKTTAATKVHGTALKAEKVEIDKVGEAYKQTIASLQNEHARLTLSARDYEELTFKTDGFNKSQIQTALAIWDTSRAFEKQKENSDLFKTEMDELIDRYNQLTMSAREYYEETIRNSGIDPALQPQLLNQFDKNAAETLKQQEISDAQQALDSYIQSLDNAAASTQNLGSITSAIFDGALGGINTVVGAFGNFATAIQDTAKEFEKLNKARGLNTLEKDEKKRLANIEKFNARELELNDEVLLAKISATRQIASAVESMLKDGSKEQEAAHAITIALAAVELAINMQKILGIGAVTAAEVASVGPQVAATTAKATAKGVEAAVTQGSGDPYTAFPRIAAMIGIVAGLLAIIGVSFSGKSASAPPPGQRDTGTVLGDFEESSDSVNRTYELLKDIHAEEYVELRGINKGVTMLHDAITGTVTRIFQSEKLGTGIFDDPNIGGLGSKFFAPQIGFGSRMNADPILNYVFGALFGQKVTKEVVGGGLGTAPISIGDTLSGDQIGAAQYNLIKTTKKGGLFRGSSEGYDYVVSQIDSDVQESLTDLFKGIGTSFVELADGLGEGLVDRVRDYVIPLTLIELRGLNAEDAAKKFNTVISTIIDDMARGVFGDIIGQYQQLGEGMFETAVRIVAELGIVRNAFEQSGATLKDNAIAIADALVQAAGGLEEFQQQFENFYDKFFTEQEKQARLGERLQGILSEVFSDEEIDNLAQGRQAFRDVMDALALDINAIGSTDKYSLLLQLADAADQYYSVLEQGAQDAAAALQQALQQYEDERLQAQQQAISDAQNQVTGVFSSLQNAVGLERKSITDAYNAQVAKVQGHIDNLRKTVSGLAQVANQLKSALDSLQFPGNELQERISAQIKLAALVQTANQTGSFGTPKELTSILNTLSKPSENLFGSFEDYQRDFFLTSIDIAALSDAAGQQLSDAEKQLELLELQLELMQEQFEEEMASLDNIITLAQEQIDAVNGTTTAVLSISQAISQLAAGIKKLSALNAGAQPGGNPAITGLPPVSTITNPPTTVEGVYNDILGRAPDASGAAYWGGLLASGAVTADNLAKTIVTSAANFDASTYTGPVSQTELQRSITNSQAWLKAQGFASGGTHSGGWRVVGERGPELENTGPSRIFSNSQSLFDSAGIIAESKLNRKMLERQQELMERQFRKLEKIEEHSKNSAYILDSVTAGGGAMLTESV